MLHASASAMPWAPRRLRASECGRRLLHFDVVLVTTTALPHHGHHGQAPTIAASMVSLGHHRRRLRGAARLDYEQSPSLPPCGTKPSSPCALEQGQRRAYHHPLPPRAPSVILDTDGTGQRRTATMSLCRRVRERGGGGARATAATISLCFCHLPMLESKGRGSGSPSRIVAASLCCYARGGMGSQRASPPQRPCARWACTAVISRLTLEDHMI